MPFDPAMFDPSQIPLVEIVFWAMTVCTIGGALGVVTSRNLFHSALYLILSFFGVSGYYVLLNAGFLAVVQLFVYVGAIAVLVLFAIMFSRRMMAAGQSQANQQWWVAGPVVIVLFVMLLAVVGSISWPVTEAEPSGDVVNQLGLAFLGSYLIPFEVVGILLSVALIGAIILAREKTAAE
ncbi:MAG: NADH-quinone oxidoreductase subunit J [Leptospiraceae bacterium]|jgi:NADH-quinone oxidoreductase subunit J|nr:NADH-quinone oxidoreductase subunit J [Anaerolineae bacterium]NUM40270.1 NADH-quinone oxidoreductase subunit J [Leptospiraceae bacterium]